MNKDTMAQAIINLLPFILFVLILTYVLVYTLTKSKVTSIIFVVIALICMIIPIKYGSKQCYNCGGAMPIIEETCPVCGVLQDISKVTGTIKCPDCGRLINNKSEQCKYCGCKPYE